MRGTEGLSREQLVLAHFSWAMALVKQCEWIRRDLWPDLHQEALVVMWRRALRYDRRRGTFAAFVRRDVEHAVRLAARRMRSPTSIGDGAGRYLRSPPETRPFPPGLAADGTPEAAVLALDSVQHLARAIRGLPPRERVVLDGRLAGRTVTEIAAILHVSHQRVTQLWAHGVRLVREALVG